jgi:hypothetical protein
MRIRIQFVGHCGYGSGSRALMSQIYKIPAEKTFSAGIAFYLSLGPHNILPCYSTGEAFSLQKRTSSISKK